MQILVNGELRQLQSAVELSLLLEQLGYCGSGFAVALNGDFVPRASYANLMLNEGDALDIVAPVVGG